jgi:hypothetical protein
MHKATWIVSALAKHPTARITIDPVPQNEANDYVATLQNNGAARLSQILGADEERVFLLRMSDGQGGQSRWYLLADGTSILLDQTAMAFPFTAQEYAAIPKLFSGQFGNLGAYVNTDGTLQHLGQAVYYE